MNFNHHSILILGLGREGKVVFKYIQNNFKPALIAVADQKKLMDLDLDTQKLIHTVPASHQHLGHAYLNHLKDYDYIIKSPGISPNKLGSTSYITPTQLFFNLCPAPIIGVTGTKGKSTTSSLIFHLLTQNQIPAVLLGNIGLPAISYLNKIHATDQVVMELSSHQLLELTTSPYLAVVLNIFPEHLDYYPNMESYVAAKANIAKYQTTADYLIFDPSNQYAVNISLLTKGKRIPIDLSLSYSSPTLLGKHNQKNISASCQVAKLLGLSDQQIQTALSTFKPLPHRLQFVAVKHSLTFIDDTLATLPEATIEAIKSLSPIGTLIAGGYERHQNFAELADMIISKPILNLILFPDTGIRIQNAVMSKSVKPPCFFMVNTMKEAIATAFTHTPKNTICLLSPASPSFTLFKDYQDESAQFFQEINNY